MGDEVVILANSLISHFQWGLRHSALLLGIFYQSNAELTEVVLDSLDLRCLQTQQFKDLSEQNNLQMKIN